jgi:hypothetical protein
MRWHGCHELWIDVQYKLTWLRRRNLIIFTSARDWNGTRLYVAWRIHPYAGEDLLIVFCVNIVIQANIG